MATGVSGRMDAGIQLANIAIVEFPTAAFEGSNR